MPFQTNKGGWQHQIVIEVEGVDNWTTILAIVNDIVVEICNTVPYVCPQGNTWISNQTFCTSLIYDVVIRNHQQKTFFDICS